LWPSQDRIRIRQDSESKAVNVSCISNLKKLDYSEPEADKFTNSFYWVPIQKSINFHLISTVQLIEFMTYEMTILCKLNDMCVCSKCCAVEFPFFSDGNFEYKALISNFYCDINNANIRYDEYVSPTKLSELTATLQKDDLYFIHFKCQKSF